MLTSPALNKYIDDLITQKHGAGLSSAGREQIKSELAPRLEKWLILKAMEALGEKSPATLRKFEELAQGGTPPSVILTFIEENIPDSTGFFTSTLVDFWTLYLGQTAPAV
jgi:hypothetical protein